MADIAEFNAAFGRLPKLLDDVREKIHEILSGLQLVSRLLPAFLGDRLIALGKKIIELLGKFSEEVAKFWTQPGNPWTVWNRSQDWTNKIQQSVSKEGSFNTDDMQADDAWKGTVADNYWRSLERQKLAIEAYADTAERINNVLFWVVTNIVGFWVALVGIIYSLVTELTAEAVGAATVVGAAPAGAAAAASTGKAIALIGGLVAVILGTLGHFAERANELRTANNNNNGFNGGNWPKAALLGA